MDSTNQKKIKVAEIDCKSALSPSRLPGFDYSLNPYRGCEHGCNYCYAPNILRVPRKEWGGFVHVKRNIPKVLTSELKHKERGTVGISTTTDPYQPLEGKYELTRLCLMQLQRYDFPVSIITKSSLITRDIDILTRFSEAEVGFTITTNNDNERMKMEPRASSIESRIQALKECSDSGITTYAFLGPLYPTTTKEDLKVLIGKLKDAGVSKFMADKLNLKQGIWESITKIISNDKKVFTIWKESLFGGSQVYDELFSYLGKICSENGLDFEMQGY
jgi:DNA repair photolyase